MIEFNQAKKFFQQYNKFFDPVYLEKIQYLNNFYVDKTRLPSKTHLTDTENAQYDANRLQFICQALDFLCAYHITGKTPLVKNLSPIEFKLYEGISLINIRYLIEHIAYTIFYLSGELRAKYKHLLQPKPFTWETFEQLGGVMKVSPEEHESFVMRNVTGEVAKRFMDEYLDKELILEASLQTILDDDIPLLKNLFDDIRRNSPDSKPVNLVATKALTRCTADVESLHILLKLSDNHIANFPHHKIISKVKKMPNNKKLHMVPVDDEDKSFVRTIDLSTKLGRHAALRRLEKIGELLKGKNFSSSLTELDPSVDWRTFITFRDVIAHQDEGDNKLKIDKLLNDPVRFKKILSDEMTEFFGRLCTLVSRRDASHPSYKGNADVFWQEVYTYEQKKQQKETPAVSVQARLSKDDAQFFIKTLRDNSAPQDIQLRWLTIFNGVGKIPDKKEYGQLLRYLPSRKDNKSLYEQCKAMADRAIDPKTDAETRQKAREKAQAEADQREKDRESRFTGLVELRAVAKSFETKPDVSHCLTPEARVDAAIEALENIKQFMEEDIFIKANFNFPSIAEWEKAVPKAQPLEFFARLKSSPEFNDALEYNAAQLLQHLDTIRGYNEAKGYQYIDSDYDSMRNLRNWVEHGNPLLDKQDYNPEKNPDIISEVQKVVGPIMITLIFKVLPALKEIKQKIKGNQVAGFSQARAASQFGLTAAIVTPPSSTPGPTSTIISSPGG